MLKNLAFRKHRNDILTLLVLIIISVAMLVCSAFSVISFKPKQVGLDFLSFFQRSIVNTGNFFSQSFNSIAELKILKKEYKELLSQYAEYEQMKHNYTTLESENAELKKQLGYLEEAKISKISATVIGGSANNFYESIIINQGHNKGIRKDMPVIAYVNGYQSLVGKVVEVGEFSSIVRPMTDHNLYVPAVLQKLRYKGLVNGDVMDFVKKDAGPRISCGDIVVTSGFNGGYPENLFIGKVKSIASKDFETSLKLKLEFFVDFNRLEYVFVLKQEDRDEK